MAVLAQVSPLQAMLVLYLFDNDARHCVFSGRPLCPSSFLGHPAGSVCGFSRPSPGPPHPLSEQMEVALPCHRWRWLSPVTVGAVRMTASWPFPGRLPTKLLIPLMLVANLSSPRLSLLADIQDVLSFKTTSLLVSRTLRVRWAPQKPVDEVTCFSSPCDSDSDICPQSRDKPPVCVLRF